MKKVLITSNLYLPNIGGIENSLYYLAKSGIQSGDDITIITSDIIDKDNIEITILSKSMNKQVASLTIGVFFL